RGGRPRTHLPRTGSDDGGCPRSPAAAAPVGRCLQRQLGPHRPSPGGTAHRLARRPDALVHRRRRTDRNGRPLRPAPPVRAAEGAAQVKGFAVLFGVAIAAWVILALPAMLFGGDGPDVTVPALLVCLAPNLLALGVVELLRTKSEMVRTAALVISFVARLFVVLGLGFAVYLSSPHLKGQERSFVLWGAVCSLLLLAAESRVVSRRMAGATAGR